METVLSKERAEIEIVNDLNITFTGPVFAHGTTGAKRTVGGPPRYIKICKTKMRRFAIL
jgi:hypothetical protein